MIRVDFLERLGVVAAMSGVCDGDCGLRDDDRVSRDNRMAVVKACDLDPERLVGAQQVHGSFVAIAGESDAGNGLQRSRAFSATDGIATRQSLLPVSITIADCVPLFLVDPMVRVGALVHAGRAGTALGIGAEAIRRLVELGARERNLHAYLGPSAGPCCYEVSAAIADDLGARGASVSGRHVNLWQTNIMALEDGGVPTAQIACAEHCTICRAGFHSYRNGAAGKLNMAVFGFFE